MREARPRWGRWYAGTLLALAGGAALILAWAVPAAIAGGPQFRDAIFWGQSAGRMVSSFAHRYPWWFYLPALPLMLAPWLLWPRGWRGLSRAMLADSGVRLLLVGLAFAFVFFSAISGKRWQYLLPEFTPFALLAAVALAGTKGGRWSSALPALTLALLGVFAIGFARVLAARLGNPGDAWALAVGGAVALGCGVSVVVWKPGDALDDVRRIASATVIAASAVVAAFVVAMREPYDIGSVASVLARYEREGRPVALNGDYHGQWTLAGRLTRPIEERPTAGIREWFAAHPDGRALFVYRKPDELPPGLRVELDRPYRGARLAILAAN
jgi:4-amino-4-deoxy-L-arabinose transferase-like glycosyltransferase